MNNKVVVFTALVRLIIVADPSLFKVGIEIIDPSEKVIVADKT